MKQNLAFLGSFTRLIYHVFSAWYRDLSLGARTHTHSHMNCHQGATRTRQTRRAVPVCVYLLVRGATRVTAGSRRRASFQSFSDIFFSLFFVRRLSRVRREITTASYTGLGCPARGGGFHRIRVEMVLKKPVAPCTSRTITAFIHIIIIIIRARSIVFLHTM